MSRVDLALLLLVLVAVVFLFWSRNVVVRAPVVPTSVPLSTMVASSPPGAGMQVA